MSWSFFTNTGAMKTSSVGTSLDGWITIQPSITYSSADSPTFVATTGSDLTSVIPVGARIKLTQTTVKYFIVTAIDATTITLYGGTDYTLANAAVTNPCYSLMKVPVGFNISPAKWTQEFTSTSNVRQATPSANTWYNIGTQTLSVPIGVWQLYYIAHVWGANPSADTVFSLTLSTANNSASDSAFITAHRSSITYPGVSLHSNKVISATSKTTFYLNAKTDSGTDLYIRGDYATTVIRAVCAYL